MNPLFRATFLISSFGPLYFIVGLKNWLTPCSTMWITYLFAALAVLSILGFVFILSRLKTAGSVRVSLVDLKPRDSDIFPYLMAYIPSLIFRDLSAAEVGIPLLFLYALILALYFRLDSPYLHPYFAILGYRIHEAKTEIDKSSVLLISKGAILSGTENLQLHEIASRNLPIYYYEHN